MKQDGVKSKKVGFFKRLKKAIFELEDYGYFLGERLTVAFKYFFKLMLFITLIVTCAISYKSVQLVNRTFAYIENELPNFEYKDGKLKFDKYVEGYDHEFGFKIIADTTENLSEEKEKEYAKKLEKNGLLLLEDEFVLISDSIQIERNYKSSTNTEQDLNKIAITLNIGNKEQFVNSLNVIGKEAIVILYFVLVFSELIISNIFVILSDVCVVAVFGWFASRLCGVNFKMNPMIALSIYALTLPIMLSTIFDVVLVLTGFSVQYFDYVYLIIAYVYIIAAIFMIKYDLIKQTEELNKIIEVQKQVKQDLEKEKQDKENDNKNDKKEDKDKQTEEKNESEEEPTIENNREPDGSEI